MINKWIESSKKRCSVQSGICFIAEIKNVQNSTKYPHNTWTDNNKIKQYK